ncbi:MAG: DNA-binding protein [Bacillota bacterium]|nr:DNA-binding protein [Bacillota bacterium]
MEEYRMVEEIMPQGKMEDKFVTITGFKNYYGCAPFAIGNLIRCSKEPDNPYDGEAIKCTLPVLGTVAYIANSIHSVTRGTMSAGRIYDSVGDRFFVRVMFSTGSIIICKLEKKNFAELEKELQQQSDSGWSTEGTAKK